MKVEIKECPCCGGGDVYVGTMSAQSQGVKCKKCGLNLSRWTPNDFPPIKNVDAYLNRHGVDAELMNDTRKLIAAVNVYTLKKAIRAWNKRPQK